MTSSVPRPLMLAGFLTLAVTAGFWWWLGGDEPGHPRLEAPTPIATLGSARAPGDDAMTPSAVGLLAPHWPETSHGQPTGGSAAAREESLLIQRLRRQGIQVEDGDTLSRQEWDLYPELVTYLRDSSNWLPELMKASSSIQPRGDGDPTRLLLERIEADSILWELGLQEGDLILLIDGEIPRFSAIAALDSIRKADALLTTLDRGESISVTVLRQDRPVHLVYQSW